MEADVVRDDARAAPRRSHRRRAPFPRERGRATSLGAAYQSYPRERERTDSSLGLAALGVFAGALVYRRLAPHEHPSDIE